MLNKTFVKNKSKVVVKKSKVMYKGLFYTGSIKNNAITFDLKHENEGTSKKEKLDLEPFLIKSQNGFSVIMIVDEDNGEKTLEYVNSLDTMELSINNIVSVITESLVAATGDNSYTGVNAKFLVVPKPHDDIEKFIRLAKKYFGFDNSLETELITLVKDKPYIGSMFVN